MSRPFKPILPSVSGEEEVERASGAECEAPDRERDQRARLEVAKQEADGEVGGRGGAKRGDERLSADAVAGRAEQVWQFENGRGADDRRGEQEGEAGGVAVREADK